MTRFTTLQGQACVLAEANIDTDQILPARFLRKPRDLQRGQTYAAYLFHDLRAADPAFPVTPGVAVLLAGANFGCGSSREGAVYALIDAGIRCVVAPGFGDIFASNAALNGLLTIVLPDAPMTGGETWVDLPAQRIGFADQSVRDFAIDPARKRQLVEGLDEIGLTLTHADAIARFAARDRVARPWASPG
jgi:3-isopropylmalate/(R)-2-methylmalate dehydratase small subunit